MGAGVLVYFTILAGARNGFPLNEFYFLRTTTSSFSSGATSIPSGGDTGVVHFTLWNVCGSTGGKNVNCGPVKAAMPFQPQNIFGSSDVPQDFISNSNYWYYLSRFNFAFWLISTILISIAVLASIAACLGRVFAGIASIFTGFALFMHTATAIVSTILYLFARNRFRNAGDTAQVGVKLTAFTWAIWAMLFLAFVMFCSGCCCMGGRSAASTKRATMPQWVRNRKLNFAEDNEASAASASGEPMPTSLRNE